ncbi:hypothetical protein F2P81_021849 [Scophthalmus maximus]|uniref:Uncharacterized protein n=1 Tax=Scophthalmus maximus TaxID=52904 RepID=A0A6A4RYH2_SCOMX|nr:hypothetical protein F2P81_021849 [Scophthalmus maximus]
MNNRCRMVSEYWLLHNLGTSTGIEELWLRKETRLFINSQRKISSQTFLSALRAQLLPTFIIAAMKVTLHLKFPTVKSVDPGSTETQHKPVSFLWDCALLNANSLAKSSGVLKSVGKRQAPVSGTIQLQ